MNRKSPVLGHGIELVLATVGASGGVKICVYVFSGQLAQAFKQSQVGLSEDDVLYFLIGGFALIWLSIDTVVRRLWVTYNEKKKGPEPSGPPPEPQTQQENVVPASIPAQDG
jgi:hypothetical protein